MPYGRRCWQFPTTGDALASSCVVQHAVAHVSVERLRVPDVERDASMSVCVARDLVDKRAVDVGGDGLPERRDVNRVFALALSG